MSCEHLLSNNGYPIFFKGSPLSQGPLPAFFYFALAGDESLELSPYNHPILHLIDTPLRIFSFTLPFHGEGHNKFHAMEHWIRHLHAKESFLDNFLASTIQAIQWLIDSRIVDPLHIAVGGISRGGFIAAHIAARHPLIHTVLAFAPLTELKTLAEYQPFASDLIFSKRLDQLSLESIIDSLLHVRSLRFYIGNRDMRVSTDAAFHFIRKLADATHDKRIRNHHCELFITSSIGHKGHGTAPETFEEGAAWIKKQLLKL